MFIVDNRANWAGPFELASELVEKQLTGPIVLGEDFLIAELGPDGVRFHTCRVRKTDSRIAVRGRVGLDPTSIKGAEERERLRRIVEDGVRRAEREALSRRRTLRATD